MLWVTFQLIFFGAYMEPFRLGVFASANDLVNCETNHLHKECSWRPHCYPVTAFWTSSSNRCFSEGYIKLAMLGSPPNGTRERDLPVHINHIFISTSRSGQLGSTPKRVLNKEFLLTWDFLVYWPDLWNRFPRPWQHRFHPRHYTFKSQTSRRVNKSKIMGKGNPQSPFYQPRLTCVGPPLNPTSNHLSTKSARSQSLIDPSGKSKGTVPVVLVPNQWRRSRWDWRHALNLSWKRPVAVPRYIEDLAISIRSNIQGRRVYIYPKCPAVLLFFPGDELDSF